MDARQTRTEPRTAQAEDVPVVIVEDDPDAREALKALVELDGYRVHTAASAEQAKAVIAEHSPLCVILDLGLPDASGIDLAHSLRSTQGNALVVIAVTGSVAPEDQFAAEAAGVDYLLHKPLDIERFRRILQPLH
jgi:DNA-binding response OmpR family regulator